MTSSAPTAVAAPSSVSSRARLGTSLEPSAIAGTSWNSVRWTRPSAGGGYRTSRLASAFEMAGSTCSSSAASSCSSKSARAHSPPFGYSSMLRSSERASSTAATPVRPQKDGSVIRANSRYGTSLLNPTGSLSRPSQSSESKRPIAYRPISSNNQPRATLQDIRQNLRPVKRQTTTPTGSDYTSSFKSSPSSTLLISPRASFSTGAAVPLVFTNTASSNKCITSPSMSRSSSSVASPVTTLTPRPIPKSERPWRQKLADAQRLRDAQEERSARLLPMEPYETTMRLLAAKANRRANIEHQQQEAEQKLEKQIAALKCYVSEPGALDKSATVAKFRQRMAEGQAQPSLTAPANVNSPSSTTALMTDASSLLSRMPSLSRRSTTAVTRESLTSKDHQQQQMGNRKNRPLSLVEVPLPGRRLSVVKETIVSEIRPEDAVTPSTPTETKIVGKTAESPKTAKKATTGQRPSSRASTTSSGSTERGVGATTKRASPKNEKKTMVKKTDEETRKGDVKKGEEEQSKKTEEERRGTTTKEKTAAGKKETAEDAGKYNAVVQFRPQSLVQRKEKTTTEEGAEEEDRPVPGTWQRSPAERCISHNKRLIRRAASASAAHVHPAVTVTRVASARMRAPGRVANKCEGAFINRLGQTHNAAILVKSKSQLPTATVLKMIKSIARPKQRLCAMAVLDKALANKRRLRLGIQKTFMLKNAPQKGSVQLRCKSSKLTSTAIRLNIVWKEQKKQAVVTILLTDVAEVNWDHITSETIREKHRNSPLKLAPTAPVRSSLKRKEPRTQQITTVQTKPTLLVGLPTNRASPPKPTPQRPPPIQPYLASQEGALGGTTQLILPDQSLLEQYVQHKRDALEQQQHDGGGEEGVSGGGGKKRGAPSPPADSKRNSQMLATATAEMAPSLTSSYHSAIDGPIPDLVMVPQQQQQHQLPVVQAKLRRPQPGAALSTQAFEKPKSLFEEQMQRQAIQLRHRAVRQSLHETAVGEPQLQQQQQDPNVLMRRRSTAAEHAVVAQSFVAQAQKPHQQEQRYAAHIPLSGRQSTTSIESNQSGVLDTATRQLDEMIDQARYRHSQHRNKFKEAIDYLDHIFEDFQKEADSRSEKKMAKIGPTQQAKGQQSNKSQQQTSKKLQQPQPSQQKQPPPGDIEPVQATFRQGSVKSAKEAFEKVAAAIASEKNNKLRKQTSAPSTSQQKNNQEQQQQQFEVEVAETIVLPTKNTADRLDFTKHWLSTGEVSVWAESTPKRRDTLLGVQGALDECTGYESDEHSLGSCSAEVAAINAADERRRQQTKKPGESSKSVGGGQQPIRHKQQPQAPAITKAQQGATANGPPPQIATSSVGTAAAIRPQPYRPQPQLGVLPPALGPQMHKVPSIEQLRLMRGSTQERAGSQDYQSMGSSVHSQDGSAAAAFRPGGGLSCQSTHSLHRIGLSGGAFHSYTPTTVQQQQQHQLKGSIQSLPDSALCAAGQLAGPAYPKAFPLQPSRQFATLTRVDSTRQHPSSNSRPVVPPTLHHQQQQPPPRLVLPIKQQHQGVSATLNEHAMAIDALVAELELNTASADPSHRQADKRRSFPTMQTEVAGRTMDSQHKGHRTKPLDELTELLVNESKRGGETTRQRGGIGGMGQRKPVGTAGGGGVRPFETINQEKLNPSKVDAMTRMFEQPSGKTSGSNTSAYFTSGPGSSSNGSQQPWNRRSTATTTAMPGKGLNTQQEAKTTPLVQRNNAVNSARIMQQQQNGDSSTHGRGATGKTSNGQHQNQATTAQPSSSRLYRGPVVGGRVMVVERRKGTPTIPEEEGGGGGGDGTASNGNNLYDNIRNDSKNQHRSRPLPAAGNNDILSLCSQHDSLPPAATAPSKGAGGKIGQLIRKLSNVGNGKPPTSAASMVSLNRVANEPSSASENVRDGGGGGAGMVKSNSLSGEPWRCQVLAQQNGGRRAEEDKPSQGIGNRLKQTIFGGVVRRRVPS